MRLQAVDLGKCAADLKSRMYEGPEWLPNITESVRLLCLQDNGYLKALVESSTQQLLDRHGTHQLVVTFHIKSGSQYRTGQISFVNNRVFSAEELRPMFKLTSGDIFSPAKMRQGLREMRCAYIDRGYLNFTPVLNTSIDDPRHVVNAVIDLDEGKQVRVKPSSIVETLPFHQ
jgi:outer membrane protein insertion porin family